MRKKLFTLLNKLYGILMMISFFAGLLPLIPFLLAVIIGGNWAEATCVFLYKQYYLWVIVVGSIGIVIGLIAMYLGKMEGLSMKKVSAEDSSAEIK